MYSFMANYHALPDTIDKIVWHTIPDSMRPRPEHIRQGSGKFKVKDGNRKWLFAIVDLDAMGHFNLTNAQQITNPVMYAVI